VKCASVSQWACKQKKTQNLAVHWAAGGDYSGEKRNVLIVSVLLPIGVDLTLRSNTQRAIEVLGVCERFAARGCKPFCCTWLLDTNLSWAMLRSKTKPRLPA